MELNWLDTVCDAKEEYSKLASVAEKLFLGASSLRITCHGLRVGAGEYCDRKDITD